MTSGGRFSRRKGDRFERSIVDLCRDHGLKAQRVPLSGSVGGSFTGDIVLELGARVMRFEAKTRSAGFKTLYSWLGNNDGLVIKADHAEPLVLLRMADLAGMLEAARKAGQGIELAAVQSIGSPLDQHFKNIIQARQS